MTLGLAARRGLLSALLVIAAAPSGPTAGAGRVTAPVRVTGAFAQATPPGVPHGSAYMTLENSTDKPVTVTGARSGAAARVTLMHQRHDTRSTSGAVMTRMRHAHALTVPAHGKLVLKPGGDHLMLEGLRRPLRAGEFITVTLLVKGGEPLTLKLPVRRF